MTVHATDNKPRNHKIHTPTPQPCPVLQAQGVVKSYQRGRWPWRHTLPVLRGADLQLCAGEVVGLVGENGSGKSTR